jgi:ERF superfamily
MNVFQRLNQAREQFHSLKLQKTGHNEFAGYYYFELGDFLIPALKVFRECGLCAIVSFDKETAMMEIRADADPDHVIRITSPMGSAALKGCHEVQNIGAVETYQRRYLWVAALEIVEHDALDATTGKDKPAPKKAFDAPHKPTDGAGDSIPEERKSELDELALYMIDCHKTGKDMDAIRLWYAADTFAADGDEERDGQEERKYVWKQLAAESKLRSAITANNPRRAQQTPAAS